MCRNGQNSRLAKTNTARETGQKEQDRGHPAGIENRRTLHTIKTEKKNTISTNKSAKLHISTAPPKTEAHRCRHQGMHTAMLSLYYKHSITSCHTSQIVGVGTSVHHQSCREFTRDLHALRNAKPTKQLVPMTKFESILPYQHPSTTYTPTPDTYLTQHTRQISRPKKYQREHARVGSMACARCGLTTPSNTKKNG